MAPLRDLGIRMPGGGGPGTPGNRNLTDAGCQRREQRRSEHRFQRAGFDSGVILQFKVSTVSIRLQHAAQSDHSPAENRRRTDLQYGGISGGSNNVRRPAAVAVVTGDLRASTRAMTPMAPGGFSARRRSHMNGHIDFGASYYAENGRHAFHEIGNALGLSHSYDAPGVMGGGVGQTSGGRIAAITASTIVAPRAGLSGDVIRPAQKSTPPTAPNQSVLVHDGRAARFRPEIDRQAVTCGKSH